MTATYTIDFERFRAGVAACLVVTPEVKDNPAFAYVRLACVRGELRLEATDGHIFVLWRCGELFDQADREEFSVLFPYDDCKRLRAAMAAEPKEGVEEITVKVGSASATVHLARSGSDIPITAMVGGAFPSIMACVPERSLRLAQDYAAASSGYLRAVEKIFGGKNVVVSFGGPAAPMMIHAPSAPHILVGLMPVTVVGAELESPRFRRPVAG